MKNAKAKYLLFRNDDIREVLDDSLLEITELCCANQIPISHTVEPANITQRTIDWLNSEKEKHPKLIEIVQHGYLHKVNYEAFVGGKLKKGEFGGKRNYEEQLSQIAAGKRLMDEYFGNRWFRLFTFPYGGRNKAAIKAVNDAGFLVVNGSLGVGWKHSLLYAIGHFLNRETLFGRKISWHLRYKPGTRLFQIDTSISVIKRFLNEKTDAEFYSLQELQRQTLRLISTLQVIGVVLHHRYHNSKEKIKLIEDYIQWLKSLDFVQFATQEEIYNLFK